jgi:lipopolysaccharide biosynthesis glycosyltransferase
VRQLWNVDLGDKAIGAVVDCYADAEAFARRWSLSKETPGYFNSGVLLIDLERVRKERLFSSASEFVARYGADILFGDQDALNWVFWGRWRKLNAAWNVQRFMSSREIAADHQQEGNLNLVHFIGFEKPWMPGVWHPWAWLYWDNLARTPFAKDVAREFGMNFRQFMRLRLRWWIKRPRLGIRWIA